MQYKNVAKHTDVKHTKIKLPVTVTQETVKRKIVIDMVKSISKLPPIKVIEYNGEYVVLDGHHRLAAYKAMNKQIIPVMILKTN